MIHRQHPLLSVEGIIWSRQGLHTHATSYNWKEKNTQNRVSVGWGGVGGGCIRDLARAAEVFKQPFSSVSRATGCAYVGPLVSHRERNRWRRRGAGGALTGGETLQSVGFISLNETDFNQQPWD